MTDNISELRKVLFETLHGLKKGDIEIDRARAINETAQVLINTAKVEIDHIRAIGGGNSTFLGLPEDAGEKEQRTARGVQTVSEAPGVRIIKHRMS
ncbi:MAG: hypothetical protein LBF61_02630 [Azoarcus sp.]|jgi:hypothetical protein|nr:hypothetical protein [Azoarcus sp.]